MEPTNDIKYDRVMKCENEKNKNGIFRFIME